LLIERRYSILDGLSSMLRANTAHRLEDLSPVTGVIGEELLNLIQQGRTEIVQIVDVSVCVRFG
jgi:hypothetical protein